MARSMWFRVYCTRRMDDRQSSRQSGLSNPTRIGHDLSQHIQPDKEIPMISELDMVVLTRDLSEHGLQKGDVGTIVQVYNVG